jgi:hypothetical protein
MFAALLLGMPTPDHYNRAGLLSGFLDDANTDVQIAAIKSVGNLEQVSPKTIELLATKLLGNPDIRIKSAIVQTLSKLGSQAQVAKTILANFVVTNRNPEIVRVGITIILSYVGPKAIQLLCNALIADNCLEVRQIAALALRQITAQIEKPSPEGSTLLKALRASELHEKNAWVRDRVVESLRNLQTENDVKSTANETNNIAQNEEQEYPETDAQFEEEENWLLRDPDAVRREKIKELIDEVSPRLYKSAAASARELVALTKQEIAHRLAPLLNKHLHGLKQDTYTEKQAIASWVNSELRSLGLAIRCPKTGRPAILIADIRSGGEESSRFRLEIVNEEGRRERTFTTAHELPDLELIEDSPRLEGLAGPRRTRS